MKCLCVLFLLSLSILASAQSYVSPLYLSPKKEEAPVLPSSLFQISFDYNYRNSKLTHHETSDNSQFSNINKIKTANIHSLSINAGKEFLENSTLSCTPNVTIGFYKGNESGATHTRFSEAISGNFYSVGTSLNYNMDFKNLRVQPYLSLDYQKSSLRYQLDYSQLAIYNKSDITESIVGLGLRLYNKDAKVFSKFQLGLIASSSQNIESNSSINHQEVVLNQKTGITNSSYVISIGLGIQF